MAKLRRQFLLNEETHIAKVLITAHKEYASSLYISDYLIELAYKGLLRELGEKKVFQLEKRFYQNDAESINPADKIENQTSTPNIKEKTTHARVNSQVNTSKKIEGFVNPMQKPA